MGYDIYSRLCATMPVGTFTDAHDLVRAPYVQPRLAVRDLLRNEDYAVIDFSLYKNEPVELVRDLFATGSVNALAVGWGGPEYGNRGFVELRQGCEPLAYQEWIRDNGWMWHSPAGDKWASVFLNAVERLRADPRAIAKTLERIDSARGRCPRASVVRRYDPFTGKRDRARATTPC
jgi:hypothetical protein